MLKPPEASEVWFANVDSRLLRKAKETRKLKE